MIRFTSSTRSSWSCDGSVIRPRDTEAPLAFRPRLPAFLLTFSALLLIFKNWLERLVVFFLSDSRLLGSCSIADLNYFQRDAHSHFFVFQRSQLPLASQSPPHGLKSKSKQTKVKAASGLKIIKLKWKAIQWTKRIKKKDWDSKWESYLRDRRREEAWAEWWYGLEYTGMG